MSAIILIDTSVYLNVLDVPQRNQQRAQVFDLFEERVQSGCHFLLPMATIWETGNHISRLKTGSERYAFAQRLSLSVRAALNGDAPFRTTYFPKSDVFARWVEDFPLYAQRNKSAVKTTEGVSLSDFSIIQEWEQTAARHSMSRVFIWSLDSDLSAYDTGSQS